ncbi:hypothetical protein PRIPAC_91848 [Pristionchus pacificus]|uniref:Uncharacterized protein n=1 Tax=Pristionchus pacificus TaxID=54126 RepID=A0A2A6CDK2_PRIPA|nr:hypothetical protein PRIPAC_91848 [Pristionchus pacificus]|eukprot:PDM76292.1 hypothetical protein PRIPAC_39896 [Pristionchus pacificus]
MLLFVVATAFIISAAPVADPQLPFLPGAFTNHAVIVDANAAAEALYRFTSSFGGPKAFERHKEVIGLMSCRV